jgi:hypothetical protein
VAKRLWRVFPSAGNSRKAFTAKDVHERSIPAPRLRKIFRDLGFKTLETRYFNASPIFFSFPMPKGLWKRWLAVDAKLAGKFTRWTCSGGLIAARREK